MIEKKMAMSVLFAVSTSLALGVGCSSDDEEDESGLGSCELLCEAAAEMECGSEADCMADCEGVEEICSDEAAAYLSCADGYQADAVTCASEITALGIVEACATELGQLQVCALSAAPVGDGDGDAGGAGRLELSPFPN